MKKNNAHHVYEFTPIAAAVIVYAIIPVAFVAAFVLHPIYTTVAVAVYIGILNFAEMELRRIERRKLLKGEAQRFTNICFGGNGGELTNAVFGILFAIYQIPLFLNSSQGPIALIHGASNYRRGFWDGEKPISTIEMANLFPRGFVYNLISCHNAYHGNFAREGQLFIRPIVTMSEYPTRFSYDEKTKSAIVWAGPEMQRISWVFLPMMLYVVPVLKAILKKIYPIEVLLYNGRGDRRNQATEKLFNKTFETIRNKPC